MKNETSLWRRVENYSLALKFSTVDDVQFVDNQTTDIIELYMPDKIIFFKNKKYKVYNSVWVLSIVLLPAITLFDLRAGPNLRQTSFSPPEWGRKSSKLPFSVHVGIQRSYHQIWYDPIACRPQAFVNTGPYAFLTIFQYQSSLAHLISACL